MNLGGGLQGCRAYPHQLPGGMHQCPSTDSYCDIRGWFSVRMSAEIIACWQVRFTITGMRNGFGANRFRSQSCHESMRLGLHGLIESVPHSHSWMRWNYQKSGQNQHVSYHTLIWTVDDFLQAIYPAISQYPPKVKIVWNDPLHSCNIRSVRKSFLLVQTSWYRFQTKEHCYTLLM